MVERGGGGGGISLQCIHIISDGLCGRYVKFWWTHKICIPKMFSKNFMLCGVWISLCSLRLEPGWS